MIQAKLRGWMPCAHLPFIRLTRASAVSSRTASHGRPHIVHPEQARRRAPARTSRWPTSPRCGRPEQSSARRPRPRRVEVRAGRAAPARPLGRRMRPAVRQRTACGSWPTATGKPVGDELVDAAERASGCARATCRSRSRGRSRPRRRRLRVRRSRAPRATAYAAHVAIGGSRSAPCTAIQPAPASAAIGQSDGGHVVDEGGAGAERRPPRPRRRVVWIEIRTCGPRAWRSRSRVS